MFYYTIKRCSLANYYALNSLTIFGYFYPIFIKKLIECLYHSISIQSKYNPKPCVGSFTKTCVTAPTMFPFCIIGLPLIP